MSSDQYLSAVEWNAFHDRYHRLVENDQDYDDYFEGCDLGLESMEFDYDAGRCLSEEFEDFRKKLSDDQRYYFHHFLFLVFPHYICDNTLTDARFDRSKVTAFDAEPSVDHEETILCMLNPDTVSLGLRLFRSMDLTLFEITAEKTWGGSDYFSDHTHFIRFLRDLGEYFEKTTSKSGGLIGHIGF